MNLTDLKVPVEKVGSVIKEVMHLCGKKPNAVPSYSTVNRIVDSKLAIAQAQISDVIGDKTQMTLYTDETKKYGKCIETYAVTDESQTSYILGLREMFNKSGESVLDTFKEILGDIQTHCYDREKGSQMNIGYNILANIRDTMSDRASTEKAFNRLLEDYRATILPQVIDNWDSLDDEQRRLSVKMNNFFCGLHLLVGMADTSEACIKKFEREFRQDKDIGSAVKPELKRYHRNESGTSRLIRTSSKAFAVGEDEKNGVSLPWRTFLQQKEEKNLILRFKHNRFNLVFLLGQAVYYHHKDITSFLESVHGTDNDLLKAVLLDSKEVLYIAGAKAFGLISKFISTPLWRLLEEKGHILEMNQNYKLLVDFLQKAATDEEMANGFITGEQTPFHTTLDMDDKVFRYLITPNDTIDNIVVPLIQNLFQAIYDLLCRMVSDHLPGGRYWNPTATMMSQTKSALKHNKLPEFVFGQLDQLLRYRPNTTLLTNESFLIYSFNKTRQWFDNQSEEEKRKLVDRARKEGKELRKNFHERLKIIQEKRQIAQKKRQDELKEREKKRMQQAEDLTNDVCFYGLWQSAEQVDEALANLHEKEMKHAIESQLKFRKVVLQQKHEDKKIYNLSVKNERGKYTKLSALELKENLLLLIQDTLKKPTRETQKGDMPLLVGKQVEHKFDNNVTYEGFVISVVPGFPEWYNIRYKDDSAIYVYNLHEDYSRGDLKIVVPSAQ